MPRTSRLAPAPKGSAAGGSMAGALLLMLAVSALVVVGIMMGKSAKQTPAPTPEPERVNPFAHMDYSDEGPKAGAWDDAGAMSAAEVDALLSSVEFKDELNNWERARDMQSEAKDLMAEFQELRGDGDADWHEVAAKAKKKYEEALQRGEVYHDALSAAIGDNEPQSTRLEKLLQAWRRDVMGLRKTVGD